MEDLAADGRPEHDRNREHERDQEAVAHVAHHRLHGHAGMAAVAHRLAGSHHHLTVAWASRSWMLVGPGGARVLNRADVLRQGLSGAVVTALLYPASKLADAGPRWVVGHVGRLRHRVGLDRQDSGPGAQSLLDHRLFAAPVDAPRMENHAGAASRQGGRAGAAHYRSDCSPALLRLLATSEPTA